jgi:hypothetical protein
MLDHTNSKEKHMKYMAIVALALMTPVALLAAPKNSAKVTFSQTITVNGTQVPPGEYRVEWQGTGASVEATILQAGKVLASSPATLVIEKTNLNGAFETKEEVNNSHILQTINQTASITPREAIEDRRSLSARMYFAVFSQLMTDAQEHANQENGLTA